MDVIIKRDHAELWTLYNRMEPVMKADLFRYLILYDVGGYYADIDVQCSQPLDTWLT
jgi:mannosyltransferase OCH1-like enzyme